MKKPILLPLLFITSLSISGVSSAFGLAEALKQPTLKTKKEDNQSEKEKSREVKKIEKIFASWVEAFNNKDIDTLMSFYDEDIMYASPTLGLVEGIDNVKAMYEKLFSQSNGTLKYVTESATEAGSMGSMGTIVLKFYIEPNEANSIEPAMKGRAMLVFKKKAFGKWLLRYDMVQPAPDVLVKDFL